MTKIDWKYVASTPGYKSLKAALIKDVQDAAKQQRPMRKKEEFHRKFHWVISRAVHYHCVTGKPVEMILSEWEDQRTYWWFSFYSDSKQPKLCFRLKDRGITGLRKYYKRGCTSAARVKALVCRDIVQAQQDASTKKRWSLRRKRANK